MNVLIIGHFPDTTKQLIHSVFSNDWQVHIVTPDQAQPYLATAEAIIPEHVPVDQTILDQAPQLKVIQTGAGYDNVDLAAAVDYHVTVCNAAGVNANAVTEHALALILSWYKNIPYLDHYMKHPTTTDRLAYTGGELHGKTLGIIGLGHVGQQLATFGQALGMHVIAYNRHPRQLAGVQNVDLSTLYANSDIISLHIAATLATHHMINAQALAQMKSSTLLVNTARGALIDEPALVSALQSHTIAGACLDVFEHEPLALDSPLRKLPNVILTPHTAGLPDGVKFHEQRYVFFRDNLKRVADGEQPLNIVN